MTTTSCVIRYHQRDQTLTVHIAGRATLVFGLPVRHLSERAIASGVRLIQFDLRDCSHLDSTMLGTLLSIKKALARVDGVLMLIAPSAACSKILYQMGLSELLPIQDKPLDNNATWIQLDPDCTDTRSFKRNVVQAHEELAELPGHSGEQFKAVVQTMKKAEEPPTEAGS